MELDYGMTRRLAELSPQLHRRYRDCVVISQGMLCRYENYFPDFTDHTVLHTLDIQELCGQLIGGQIEKLTAEDLYVLLMGALFHDVGMGVSAADFDQFRVALGLPEPADDTARAWAVRDHHQELSGLYLEKYWEMLDFILTPWALSWAWQGTPSSQMPRETFLGSGRPCSAAAPLPAPGPCWGSAA